MEAKSRIIEPDRTIPAWLRELGFEWKDFPKTVVVYNKINVVAWDDYQNKWWHFGEETPASFDFRPNVYHDDLAEAIIRAFQVDYEVLRAMPSIIARTIMIQKIRQGKEQHHVGTEPERS